MRDILLTALSTGAVFGFIQFIVTRHDNKDEEKKKMHDDIKDIKEQLKKNEKDTLRTQMLLLILMKPEEKHELLTLGERYFKVLKGNWYMTSVYKRWLKDMNVEKPDWFDNGQV